MNSPTPSLRPRLPFSSYSRTRSIGLPTPRPALRLVMTTGGETEMRFSKAPHDDVTQKMAAFTADYLPKIGDLSGFIVCAKSPSCGMERVRLYDENGNRGRKEGVGASRSSHSCSDATNGPISR